MNFDLLIKAPLPQTGVIGTMGIDSDVTSMTISNALPGGFNTLQVGLRDMSQAGFFPAAGVPNDVVPFAHVEVYAGARLLFEGRIQRIQRTGAQITGFEAVGYGIWATQDNPVFSTNATLISAGTVLKSMIAVGSPLLRIGTSNQFQDTAVGHPLTEFDGMTPSQVIDTLSKEGGGGAENVLVDFMCWEARTAYWVPRVPPRLPDRPQYEIPLDPTVAIDDDYSDAVGTVYARYTPSGGIQTTTVPVSDPTFTDRYGVSRAKLLQVSQKDDAGALQAAHTYLTQHKLPVTAITVTRDQRRGLEQPGGADVDCWLPRAGEWVQVGNLGPYVIVQHDFDAMAVSSSTQLGAYSPELLDRIQELFRVAGVMAALLSPVSGAKLVGSGA